MATPIVITPPASNTAAEWNAQIKDAAEKAGVKIPEPGAKPEAAAHEPGKKDDQETIYQASVTVNGKEILFSDKDPAVVLKQVTAAMEAAQPAPAAAVVEEPKPAFTDAELFDISLKLQKGEVTALETYIEKSGVLDRWLESKGVKVEDLKAQTSERQSQQVTDQWKAATEGFLAKVKAGESDYPGGEQNTRLMGYMIAELGLKPSVESFETAYAELKKRNMVFPVAKTEATEEEKKAAAAAAAAAKPRTSSTAVGTTGGQETRQVAPTGKVELDITKLTPREYTESWNHLMQLGYKPEQIVIKQ